jgi:hypothetical protein
MKLLSWVAFAWLLGSVWVGLFALALTLSPVAGALVLLLPFSWFLRFQFMRAVARMLGPLKS